MIFLKTKKGYLVQSKYPNQGGERRVRGSIPGAKNGGFDCINSAPDIGALGGEKEIAEIKNFCEKRGLGEPMFGKLFYRDYSNS